MEITKTSDVKTLRYGDKDTQFDVFNIPLDNLIYNKYNGRIKSIVKSYESGMSRDLNPKNIFDANIIESFLFDSAEHRNEKTIQSLRDYGQQEIGIVTKDMIVIDGNRRVSLLRKIAKQDNTDGFFKAIILPDKLSESPLEIIKLETNYQMGVDNKVEYKPIEKYLRCKELISDYKVSLNEVSKLMSETEFRILQWLDILKLMEEYLDYLNSPFVYTRLDKTEGHFVDLFNYLNKYKSQGVLNIDELKQVYFDYIRLGLPVQRLRVIGNPNNSMSLFARSDYWKSFYIKHLDIKNNLNEINFQELKKKHIEKSNEEIFIKLDREFKDTLDESLKLNLVSGEIYIKSIQEKTSLKKELKRIKLYLNELKITENISEEKNEIDLLFDQIIKIIQDLKNKL